MYDVISEFHCDDDDDDDDDDDGCLATAVKADRRDFLTWKYSKNTQKLLQYIIHVSFNKVS